MSINITRREAAQVYIAAVCSAWVTVLGTGIALTENTASMMRYARRNSPPVPANVAGQAIPAHASATLSHPAIETLGAPQAQGRRKADQAEPSCCAIYPQVSIGSERSDLRVILPTSGAVPVDSSHGVRRVLGPVESWLTETVPGLASEAWAQAQSRYTGVVLPPTLRSQGGVRSVPAVLGGTEAAGSFQMLGGGAAWSGIQTRPPSIPSERRATRGLETNRELRTPAYPTGRHLQAFASLYEVTAYAHGCTMPRSGRERPAQRGADGRWPEVGVTVAADAALHPFGTELLIAGLGFRTVGDRGHAIKGRRLDLFMATCDEARAFGRRWVDVVPVPAQSMRYASLGGAQ